MNQYTALLDANVLYPAPLRDLLMQLAVMGMFHAKWTADQRSNKPSIGLSWLAVFCRAYRTSLFSRFTIF